MYCLCEYPLVPKDTYADATYDADDADVCWYEGGSVPDDDEGGVNQWDDWWDGQEDVLGSTCWEESCGKACVTTICADDLLCADADDGAADLLGLGCAGYYVYNPLESMCGNFDNADFSANMLCCACGGGRNASDNGEVCFGDGFDDDGSGANQTITSVRFGDYVVQDWGAFTCTEEAGTAILTYDECAVAAVQYSVSCESEGIPHDEYWVGTKGCHVQYSWDENGIATLDSFQFNNNMDGQAMDNHAPVCTTANQSAATNFSCPDDSWTQFGTEHRCYKLFGSNDASFATCQNDYCMAANATLACPRDAVENAWLAEHLAYSNGWAWLGKADSPSLFGKSLRLFCAALVVVTNGVV